MKDILIVTIMSIDLCNLIRVFGAGNKLNSNGILKKGQLSIATFIEEVINNKDQKIGAIGCFFGIVRGHTKSGKKVKMLELESYKETAEKAFKRISEEVKKDFGVMDVYIHHFTGKLDVGDLIMAIVVTGPHRKNVFPALKAVVERVKSEATIWKKEHLESGETYWIQSER